MQCFLDSGYAALLLTSARTLDIDFDCRGHILNDSRISTSEEMSYFVQNILEFFNYIRQIAPNIKGVSVQWESIYTKTEGLDDDSTFSNVILKLAKGMSDVSLYGYMNPKAIGRYVPDAFSGLAALSYASRDSEMGLEIIRINAKTLQRLVIIGMADACVNRLFYHEDNSDEPIIYPSLKKLTLYCNDHLVSQPVREHVCHFPKLESIRLDGSYPALSSIFFNENKTLKDTGFSVL
ncbi:hypothetical protein LPJ56_000615 [Coemansia sp. RSA 2599]|nr:hypothetical protein LPJ56_000615 [Coemansia sp. RSA 2599]